MFAKTFSMLNRHGGSAAMGALVGAGGGAAAAHFGLVNATIPTAAAVGAGVGAAAGLLGSILTEEDQLVQLSKDAEKAAIKAAEAEVKAAAEKAKAEKKSA